jgi:hypothetical protein
VAGIMAAMRRGRRAVCRSMREASGGAAAVDRVSVLPGMMCSTACVAGAGEEARRVSPRKKMVAVAACGDVPWRASVACGAVEKKLGVWRQGRRRWLRRGAGVRRCPMATSSEEGGHDVRAEMRHATGLRRVRRPWRRPWLRRQWE